MNPLVFAMTKDYLFRARLTSEWVDPTRQANANAKGSVWGCFIPIERLAHDGKALLPFDQPWPSVYSQISFSSAEMSHVLSVVPLPFRSWGTRRICATACLVPWMRLLGHVSL